MAVTLERVPAHPAYGAVALPRPPLRRMSLTGLLDLVATDPALRAALARAGDPVLDLVAPSALRPFVAAAGRSSW